MLPGIFYRGGAEQKIRKYLVDNNFVETVIALARIFLWNYDCGKYFSFIQA